MAATVLALHGLGWGASDVLKTNCQSFATTGGNTYQKVPYDAEFGSIPQGVAMLDAAIEDRIANTADDVIVFGHSMGAQVASEWLNIYGVSKSYLSGRLRFRLIGNPSRKFGHPVWPVNDITRLTPDNTAFEVVDVCRIGDGWGNYPRADNLFNNQPYNMFAYASALVGMLTVHGLYGGVNLHDPNGTAIASKTVGNTSYYLMA